MKHQILYQQRDFPVMQNRLYATRKAALNCPMGDIKLIQNKDTGIIHNIAFNQTHIQYDQEYQNDQSLSPAFRAHMIQVLDIVHRHFGLAPVIEVGCGKGVFLEMMLAAGMDAMGVDPAYEGTSSRVVRAFFTPGIYIRPGHVVLRHVLEHVQDPLAFLHTIRAAAGHGKQIYIEVPSFNWILDNNAWYDIYYEHVNYFRLDDFQKLFSKVREYGSLFGDQYIYVVADLDDLVERIEEPKSELLIQMPEDFGPVRLQAEADRVFVWGAASKGVIYSLLQIRQGVEIHGCVDINPSKQGRFLPVTGLEVLAPEQVQPLLTRDSLILVANPMYLEEVMDMTCHRCRYDVIQ